MKILGIDPGIALTGYGLIEDREDGSIHLIEYGTISTPAKTPVEKRLLQIHHEMQALLKKHQPDSAGIEQLLFGRNVTTAITVGQARGVVILAIAEQEIPIVEYTPAKVKQAVAGYGNADKGQMQEMVRLLLNLDEIPRPDDAADALAVAITHLHTNRYNRLIE